MYTPSSNIPATVPGSRFPVPLDKPHAPQVQPTQPAIQPTPTSTPRTFPQPSTSMITSSTSTPAPRKRKPAYTYRSPTASHPAGMCVEGFTRPSAGLPTQTGHDYHPLSAREAYPVMDVDMDMNISNVASSSKSSSNSKSSSKSSAKSSKTSSPPQKSNISLPYPIQTQESITSNTTRARKRPRLAPSSPSSYSVYHPLGRLATSLPDLQPPGPRGFYVAQVIDAVGSDAVTNVSPQAVEVVTNGARTNGRGSRKPGFKARNSTADSRTQMQVLADASEDAGMAQAHAQAQTSSAVTESTQANGVGNGAGNSNGNGNGRGGARKRRANNSGGATTAAKRRRREPVEDDDSGAYPQPAKRNTRGQRAAVTASVTPVDSPALAAASLADGDEHDGEERDEPVEREREPRPRRTRVPARGGGGGAGGGRKRASPVTTVGSDEIENENDGENKTEVDPDTEMESASLEILVPDQAASVVVLGGSVDHGIVANSSTRPEELAQELAHELLEEQQLAISADLVVQGTFEAVTEAGMEVAMNSVMAADLAGPGLADDTSHMNGSGFRASVRLPISQNEAHETTFAPQDQEGLLMSASTMLPVTSPQLPEALPVPVTGADGGKEEGELSN